MPQYRPAMPDCPPAAGCVRLARRLPECSGPESFEALSTRFWTRSDRGPDFGCLAAENSTSPEARKPGTSLTRRTSTMTGITPGDSRSTGTSRRRLSRCSPAWIPWRSTSRAGSAAGPLRDPGRPPGLRADQPKPAPQSATMVLPDGSTIEAEDPARVPGGRARPARLVLTMTDQPEASPVHLRDRRIESSRRPRAARTSHLTREAPDFTRLRPSSCKGHHRRLADLLRRAAPADRQKPA